MFEKHIADFNKNILGLREFVDLIAPFLDAKQKEHSKSIGDILISAMLDEALSKKVNWTEDEKEKIDAIKSKIDLDIIKGYERPTEFKVEETGTQESDKPASIKISFRSNKIMNENIENVARAQNHMELLYKNSLISLLSSVEWFFSEILHFYFDKHPGSSGIQKKTMTLSDLKSFGSIRDAEKYLVDTKIEEVLRGSFDSWLTLLRTELSLNLGYINSIEEELVEIYQRRNILVHNGGVVNSIYLFKVKEEYRSQLKLNERVKIDKSYLDNAIRKLQKAFILIAAELWKKLDKDDKKRVALLKEIIYENLLKSRWDISEGLCFFVLKDGNLDPVDKIITQLNFWLCKKRLNQFEDVRDDVNKTDYSDKKELLQLGLFAIKDDKDSFLKTLPIALNSDQISVESVEEFPIFEEMRSTSEYKEFVKNSGYFNKNNDVLKEDPAQKTVTLNIEGLD